MENVELKKKVTLKRKGESGDSKPPKSKLWLWLLLLAIVAIVVILCVLFCGKDSEPVITEPIDPKIEQPAIPTDETPTDTEEQAVEPETTPETPTTPKAEPKPADPSVKPATKPTQTVPQGNLDEKAKQVIRGDYGNGAERKQALGKEYDAIQQRVNEMYHEGNVW